MVRLSAAGCVFSPGSRKLRARSWDEMSFSTSARSEGSAAHARAKYAARSSASRPNVAWNNSRIFSQRSGVMRVLPADLLVQPCFGHRPIARHRARRHMENFRYLVDRQSPKKSQLHDSTLLRVELLQTFDSVIEREQVNIARVREIDCFLHR